MQNYDKLLFFRNQQMRLSGRLRALSFKNLRKSDLDIAEHVDSFLQSKSLSLPLSGDLGEGLKLLAQKERKYVAELGRSELYLATAFINEPTLGLKAPLILIPITLSGEKSEITFSITGEAMINKLLIYKLAFEKTNTIPDQNSLETEMEINSLTDIMTFQNQIADFFSLTPKTDAITPLTFPEYTAAQTSTIEAHFIIAQMPNTTSSVIFDYTRLMNQDSLSPALDELINQKKTPSQPRLSALPPQTFVSSNESQDAIIASIIAGNNSIVQGPPGTGKSQLIANLVFQALLQNKRILFVSEKKTAIDVVDKRIGDLNNYAMYMSDVRDKQAFFDRIKSSVSTRITPFQNATFNQNVGNERKSAFLKLARLQALLQLQKYFTDSAQAISLDESNVYSVNPKPEQHLNPKQQKGFNQLLENYIANPNDADLAVLEQYIKHGKYSLLSKIKHLFKKEITDAKSTLEQAALNLYTSQGNTSDLNGLAKATESLDLNQLIDEAFSAHTQALTSQNTNALTQLTRLLSMFQASDPLIHVSRLKTYPRKSLYNFAQENKDALMQFYPIWIMSIDAALEVLPQEQNLFDFVVVDEGSQVEYSKILPLMNRAKNYVIVGDKQQLQPMEYFSSSVDFDQINNEELKKELEDFEEGTLSIIDFAERVIAVESTHMLMNHYRSADSQLIKFSNQFFYQDKMNVVSKMDFFDPKVIDVIDVKGSFSSEKGVNEVELEEIIKQTKRIMAEKPGKSIGIVVMNKQMEVVVDRMLEAAIARDDEFSKLYSTYMATEKIDPIIIKNLESIQGDERDIIILALTYGITESGRLNNLGPITYAGGKNRINVAITRSKEKMIVIKSLRASDFTADSEHSEGRQVFHDYIQFLDSLQSNTTESTTPSATEISQLTAAIEAKYPNTYIFRSDVSQGLYTIHLVLINKETNKQERCFVFVDQINWTTPYFAYYYHQFLTDRKWKVTYLNSKRFNDQQYLATHI